MTHESPAYRLIATPLFLSNNASFQYALTYTTAIDHDLCFLLDLQG